MKGKYKTIIVLVLFVAIMSAASIGYNVLIKKHNPASEPQIHSEKLEIAPDFSVEDEEGNEVKLSDFKGKPVILNFWATWCGPCKTELPGFDALNAEYSDKIQFMMINLVDGIRETVDGTKLFVKENGYSFPLFFDISGEASNAYGTYSIPVTVLINRDGNIVKTRVGTIHENLLRKYINELLLVD